MKIPSFLEKQIQKTRSSRESGDKRTNLRISLILFLTVVLLVLFLSTIVLEALIVAGLINSGSISIGTSKLNLGAFIVELLIWGLILGSVLTFFLSFVIMKPVNKILNAIHSLAQGDYSARLSFRGFVSRNKTARELTESFNTMAAELQQTEMLRSDFINNFSHEFKTPIVSISGFAKLLRRGKLTEEERNEYLNIIEEESLRLAQMATNVLNLTKVENQTILTDLSRFNLSEQIRTCVLMLERKWEKKNLEFSLPAMEYYINGNEELFKEVWINLFDNAVKFSHDNSTVDAEIRQDEKVTSITISNYGDPIPEENMDKIFNKFYQADESHAAEGNGVGLAIVRKVVDLHGGTVSVRCADNITSFTVTLPRRPAQ